MRAAKWHNEIEIFRQIKPCIIKEGNILDQFQYPTEPFRNRHLPEYLYKLLKDLGYNVVVIYDESKGFYAVSGGQKDLVAFADLLQDVPGLRLTNDMIRCPFSAQGSCYTPSNPESADSARNKNDGQLLDSVCPAAATIGEAVTNALRQSDVSVAIIMDMASRYIVSPDQMDLLDVRVYTELQRALRCAEEADTNGSLSKNLLVFLTNKVNDLPTWFYLNNPDVKAISITTPDAQARLEFVSSNQLSQFFQRDIYAEDMRFYTDNPSQLDKLQKKFVGLTEGFSYSDLIGMRTLCYREHYRMSHLANVVDLYRYGIKENKWATVDRNTIDQLQKDMYANILGQNSALAKVMDVIKRSVVGRGGVSNNRPKGVLFFAGPTGTGKTETAKALARNIFGDESCCLRFDMAEYKQSHSDQKLLGAPPGYIGYEAGGQLTNAVRDNPFSIILFDEIEKAHPSILDKFLQILDDGRLTDGQGIITNGIALTKRAAILLAEIGVNFAQITLDGTRNTYRIAKGVDAYNTVLNNIQSAVGILPIDIRLNITRDNKQDIVDLIDDLFTVHELAGQVQLTLAQVVDYVGCEFNSALCLDGTEYAKFVCGIFKDKEKAGKGSLKRMHLMPKVLRTFCGMENCMQYVIGADGELYKCEHSVGKQNEIVGDIGL